MVEKYGDAWGTGTAAATTTAVYMSADRGYNIIVIIVVVVTKNRVMGFERGPILLSFTRYTYVRVS